WSSTLKRHLNSGDYAKYSKENIRIALYRPFMKQYLYFDSLLIDRIGLSSVSFPVKTEQENRAIVTVDVNYRIPSFVSLMTDHVVDMQLSSSDAYRYCPFSVYGADGGNRRENITDWALGQFRAHYQDESISKWDIFYYVYGLLHHPGYRERYADN